MIAGEEEFAWRVSVHGGGGGGGGGWSPRLQPSVLKMGLDAEQHRGGEQPRRQARPPAFAGGARPSKISNLGCRQKSENVTKNSLVFFLSLSVTSARSCGRS